MGRFNTVCDVTVWENLAPAFSDLHTRLINCFETYDDLTDSYPFISNGAVVFLYGHNKHVFDIWCIEEIEKYVRGIQAIHASSSFNLLSGYNNVNG